MVDYIQYIRSFSDIGMFILIWLVQLVIYPAFHVIEKKVFVSWHARYTRNISAVVLPLMTLQFITTVYLLMQQFSGILLIEAGLILTAWAITFIFSVPCHKKLHDIGRDETTINRLVWTNWIRTVSWTVVMLLGWII